MGAIQRWKQFRTDDRVARTKNTGRPPPTVDVSGDDTIPNIVPEQVYHDAALANLNTQVSSSDVLDNKASQSLTVGSAALPLTFALVNAGRTILDEPDLADWSIRFFIAAIAFYGLILVFNVVVSCMRGISFRPDIETLQRVLPDYLDDPLGGRVLKAWVADEYLASISRNRRFLRWKARWVWVIQISLAFEGAALGLGTITSLFL